MGAYANKREWLGMLRLPVLEFQDMFCLVAGGDPQIGKAGSQFSGVGDENCDTVISSRYPVASKVLKVFQPLGIGKPSKPTAFSGRAGFSKGTGGAEQGAYVGWLFQSRKLVIEGSITIFGFPAIPLSIVWKPKKKAPKVQDVGKPFAPTPILGQARRRRAGGGGGLPMVMGVEFTSIMLSKAMKEFGFTADWIQDALKIVGKKLDIAFGLVYSSAEVITSVEPDLVPDLNVLQDIAVLPKGLTLMLSLRLPYGPCKCDNGGNKCKSYQFCSFIRKYFGDPGLSLWIGGSGSGISLGVALSNVILVRDECKSAAGSKYELGRPLFTLQALQMSVTLAASEISLSIDCFLVLDIGNILNDDKCAYKPDDSEA